MTQPDIAALAREACVIEHTSAIEIGPPCSCCERIVAAIRTAEKSAWTRGYEHGLRGANISLAASQARVREFDSMFAEQLKEFGTIERLVDAYREAKMEVRVSQARVGRLVEAARATQAWLIENGIGGHHHTCSGQDDAISCDCPGTAVAAALAAAEPSEGAPFCPGRCPRCNHHECICVEPAPAPEGDGL